MLGHKSGACFFQSCDEQDVSHTPKTNMDTQYGGLEKMAPLKIWPFFGYLQVKFQGGICRVL